MIDVLLVGGGTAGHVLPAVATAQALRRQRPDLRLAFAGRPGSLEERLFVATGEPFLPLQAVALTRQLSPALLTVAPRLLRAVRLARRLLLQEQVRTVASFGGYVALPVALAARRRVPLLLHEQNSHAGVANRLAARFADRIALTFPSSAEGLGRAARDPARRRVHVTGNPVRAGLDVTDGVGPRAAARGRLGLDADRGTVLVFGGSQGARSINRAVTAAAERWRDAGLQVLHVTGPQGYEQAATWWAEAGADPDSAAPAVRVVPYLDDMTDAYAAADVVVARAGATTIAELSVVGLPAVLVPYPHATGDHQRTNAEALVRVGAAHLIDDGALTPTVLADAVTAIVGDPARHAAMRTAARAWARPDAADGVARLLLELRETQDG